MAELMPETYQTPVPVSAACVSGAHDDCGDMVPACGCDCHEEEAAA